MKKKKLIDHLKYLGKTITLMCMGALIFLLVLSVYDTNFSIKKYVRNTFSISMYNIYARNGNEDNFSNEVVKFCAQFEYSAQPQCVVAQLVEKYNYTDHLGIIRTPDDFIKNGGVCRDISVTYAIIFKKLNFDVQYIFPTQNHVFVRVYKYWDCNNDSICYINCDIDGLNKKCSYTGD